MKIFEIKSSNRNELFHVIQDIGNFCYFDTYFYLATSKTEKEINAACTPYGSIKGEITGRNYSQLQNQTAKQWCYEKLLENKLAAFEASEEGQERIQLISKYLDALLEQHGKEVMNIGKETANTNDPNEPTPSSATESHDRD